jgi:hypothetical protein
MVIVIAPPRFDLYACIFNRFELHHIQALIAQPPIERLYVPVFSGFSKMDEVELHASPIRRFHRRFRRELRAVIDCDRHRRASSFDRPVRAAKASLPPNNRSWTKSMLQRPYVHRARGTGPRCRLMCVRRRTHMLICRPSKRYQQHTRFRFTFKPSRRSMTWIR